jgi:hypothetical protein
MLDNDMVVVKNIDALFTVPTPAGVAEPKRAKVGRVGRGGRLPVTPGPGPYSRHLCSNGGLQVFTPSAEELRHWTDSLQSGRVKSYNSGEQGFLCAMLKPWHEVPYAFDTFASQWLSSPQDLQQARVLHYIVLSSEPDFCLGAFKRRVGCGKEARVPWMRSAWMVRIFWTTFQQMQAAYGLNIEGW